jgi:hypothetical protein
MKNNLKSCLPTEDKDPVRIALSRPYSAIIHSPNHIVPVLQTGENLVGYIPGPAGRAITLRAYSPGKTMQNMPNFRVEPTGTKRENLCAIEPPMTALNSNAIRPTGRKLTGLCCRSSASLPISHHFWNWRRGAGGEVALITSCIAQNPCHVPNSIYSGPADRGEIGLDVSPAVTLRAYSP